MMVVSSRLGAPANPFVPVWPNGCSAEVSSLTAAWRDAVSKPPTRLRLRSPSPGRAQVQRDSGHLRCPLAEKGSFPKGSLATPYLNFTCALWIRYDACALWILYELRPARARTTRLASVYYPRIYYN